MKHDRITISMSEDEADDLRAAARMTGLNISEFVRRMLHEWYQEQAQEAEDDYIS